MKLKKIDIAIYVYIESEIVDFIASDNYFSMAPGESREISVRITNYNESVKKLKERELSEQFYVGSLYDLI